MCSGMTERNIQTELHRFHSLKTHIHKVNRLTDILHSRMYSCTRARTRTHAHTRARTRTHTHAHAHAHARTHTHTHTHTQNAWRSNVLCTVWKVEASSSFPQTERVNRTVWQVTLFLVSKRSCESIHH